MFAPFPTFFLTHLRSTVTLYTYSCRVGVVVFLFIEINPHMMPIVFCYGQCSLFSMRVNGLGIDFSGSIVPLLRWNKFQWWWRLLNLDMAIYTVESAQVCDMYLQCFHTKKNPDCELLPPSMKGEPPEQGSQMAELLHRHRELWRRTRLLSNTGRTTIPLPVWRESTSWCHPSALNLLNVFTKKKNYK